MMKDTTKYTKRAAEMEIGYELHVLGDFGTKWYEARRPAGYHDEVLAISARVPWSHENHAAWSNAHAEHEQRVCVEIGEIPAADLKKQKVYISWYARDRETKRWVAALPAKRRPDMPPDSDGWVMFQDLGGEREMEAACRERVERMVARCKSGAFPRVFQNLGRWPIADLTKDVRVWLLSDPVDGISRPPAAKERRAALI